MCVCVCDDHLSIVQRTYLKCRETFIQALDLYFDISFNAAELGCFTFFFIRYSVFGVRYVYVYVFLCVFVVFVVVAAIVAIAIVIVITVAL